MNSAIIIIILLLIFITLYYKYFNIKIEGADFDMDPLHIPENPTSIDDATIRRYVRIIGIDKDLKFDKYGRIERVTFKKPKPELGEKKCKRIPCPPTFTSVACWTCS